MKIERVEDILAAIRGHIIADEMREALLVISQLEDELQAYREDQYNKAPHEAPRII